MKLKSIQIQHFRSMERAEIRDCGQFNVLIGKNNSGKSNILSAIELFFQFAAPGQVATVRPIAEADTDHFQRRQDRPIVLSAVLAVDESEADAIIGEISAEAPQMANALEGLRDFRGLAAELSFIKIPTSVNYVSRLSLLRSPEADLANARNASTLLLVNEEAAAEIARRRQEQLALEHDLDALHRFSSSFDPDDFGRVKETLSTRSGVAPPFAYYTRNAPPMSRTTSQLLERSVRSSEDYEAFLDSLQNLIGRLGDDLHTASETPNDTPINTFSGESHIIPSYVTNTIKRISQMRVLHLAERRKPIGQEEASRLLRLKMSRGKGAVLQGIQSTVTDLLGVEIDAFASDRPTRPVGTARSRPDLPAELDVDNFLVQVNGSGVRESLRLLLDYAFEEPRVLLVEEPEVHLHPALEISVMGYLKRISADCQVFLTTHSTNFLDTAEMRNVYLISKDRQTHVQRLDMDEAESEIPKELGIRLSSLFMYDRLIFVEGPTDEAVLREFAAKLGINLGQANVGFIAMGGVRNFTHYAASATLAFLSKRRVQMWFILDHDEQGAEEIERLTNNLGDLAHLHVLNRRELENYLVSVKGLARLIKLKRSEEESGTTEIDLVELERVLQETCDSLKEIAIERRVVRDVCRPIFPNREAIIDRGPNVDLLGAVEDQVKGMTARVEEMRQQGQSALERATEEVNQRWDKDKFGMVPGDLLIDATLRKFGLRFRKDRDTARLASLIPPADIPSEINDILSEVTS